MRVLAAMVAFRESQPIELWDRFVPKKDGKRAAKDLARLRRRDPHGGGVRATRARGTCPIRWFVLFRDEERELVEDDARPAASSVPHDHPSRDAPGGERDRRSSAAPTWARSAS